MTAQHDRSAAADAILEQASRRPEFVQAAQAFMRGRLPEAERGARAILARHPRDPAATLLLVEIAGIAGLPAEAIALLRSVSTVLPGHRETLTRLAELLFRQSMFDEARTLLDQLTEHHPDDLRAATIRLSLLTQIGAYDEADKIFRELIARRPAEPSIRLGHAHLLRTLGRLGESAETYRAVLARMPASGEAWWGLADLKSGELGAHDISVMSSLLQRPGIDPGQELHLQFALGKAEEDAGRYEASFTHYAEANRIARKLRPYDAAEAAASIDRSIQFFDEPYFDRRSGWGSPSTAPIFIVGMPRAGSTLLEQMLASHPAIEGTAELPYIPQIAHELLAERWSEAPVPYPNALAAIDAERARVMGERYLTRATIHRITDRPFFIDKLNDNWPHIGLIHTILPQAIIIDARREAMACCFANFKQHFTRGRDFAYDQTDIARQYRDYVRYMDHVATVLPGRVLRVEHERLLADPEAELRRVVDHIGLAFDPACLRFYENKRPVRTASAAQVRRPLDPHSGELWRRYRPWLGEMERALGPLAPPSGEFR
ncbi:tetratricopeptide repeat-containing sulfotransferase family protein [Sphingomonas sp.]|jgi:tetratricopeptide (TPR) repeat protein|uniref:tetratricopeptide repeat-containing sulfotransferase family protein n=1 Tax=Sphingomonas sp. TaxID=28214 RepID=UPI002D802CE6|nr:sulfotransferase [Sphingomonas sp.]HEU0044870.1 sulfotransferase [Sphingomonas sp.]